VGRNSRARRLTKAGSRGRKRAINQSTESTPLCTSRVPSLPLAVPYPSFGDPFCFFQNVRNQEKFTARAVTPMCCFPQSRNELRVRRDPANTRHRMVLFAELLPLFRLSI
jgi:hypothetical protein